MRLSLFHRDSSADQTLDKLAAAVDGLNSMNSHVLKIAETVREGAQNLRAGRKTMTETTDEIARKIEGFEDE